MKLYRLLNNSNYILRTSDNASIPNDVNNSDYIAYLEWLSEGNTPDPALPVDKTWPDIIGQRNQLLQESDWTQLPDVPLTPEKRAEWVTYRGEVRTVTERFSNPNDVVFPTPPTN